MKKLIAIFGVLILTGLGCAGSSNGPWRLTFDLPQNWVMYSEGDKGFLGVPADEITPDMTGIVLQNKLEVTYIHDPEDLESMSYDGQPVIVEGYSAIRARVLDSRRIVPRNAEVVSKYIVKDRVCGGDMSACEEGEFPFEYYFVDGDTKIEFEVFGDQSEITEIENILKSAKRTRI